MPFLNVLEECSCPLQSCCLVSVDRAEGNEKIELITTNPDPAPAGKHQRLSTTGQREGKNTENRKTTHMCDQPWTLGTACVCYKLCVLVLLHTSHLIFTEWVKCFEISFCLFTEGKHKDNHNETEIFSFPSNKHQTLTSCTALSRS